MATAAELSLSLTVRDGTEVLLNLIPWARWAVSTYAAQTYLIAPGAFQALVPPAGAQSVLIDLGSSPAELTLKGAQSDSGFSVAPETGVTAPILLPLGAVPLLGIQNDSPRSQTVKCYFA